MVRVDDNEAVVIQYRDRIYRLAFSIVRNEKDAEDVLQNTLLKIYRNLWRFEARSKLSTWIYRIAYNESLMHLRKKRRLFNSRDAFESDLARKEGGFAVSWPKLPAQELLNKELREQVDIVLAQLPIQYRMPLLLHRIEGLSLAECARILAVTQSTVKTRLHRAYCAVRDALSRYYKDQPVPVAPLEAGCPLWSGFVYAYANDALNPGEKALFDRHIADCPSCTGFLDSYLAAVRITGQLECRDIPGALKEKIKAFFASKKA